MKSSHKFLGRSPDCLWWIGLALVITGCGGSRGLPCLNSDAKNNDASANPQPFANLQVQVGVDGSESMQGFVNRPGSRYSQAIASLHTLLQSKGVPTTYWRIGSNSQVNTAQKISAGQFLEASKLAFYCQRGQETADYPCVSSTLGQFYELASPAAVPSSPAEEEDEERQEADRDPQSLKILLTDLEPDNAAVGQISGLISEELKQNPDYKAVLIGVRSQFQGNVYSANAAFSPFAYSTAGQDIDQSGRPFYILISGPETTVDELVKQFRQLPLKVNKAFRASTFQLEERSAVTLDNTPFQNALTPCLEPVGMVNRQRPNGDQEEDWLMFEEDTRCTQDQDKPIELQIPSKKTVSLTGGELTPDLFEVSIPSVVTVKDVQIEQNATKEDTRLQLTLAFDGDKLNTNRGELIYVTLLDRNLDRAVWQDWDMDVTQPDGSKTQNLRLFVSGLRQAMGQEQNAVKFCLGYSRY